jgi:hypothetical protein
MVNCVSNGAVLLLVVSSLPKLLAVEFCSRNCRKSAFGLQPLLAAFRKLPMPQVCDALLH